MIEEWKVEQVMSAPAQTVALDAGFKEIVRTLEAHHISAVPVVDETGRVQGVVSEADLVLKEERSGDGGSVSRHGRRQTPKALEKAEGQVAWQLMTDAAATVRPETPLPDAARTMRELGVRRLVVTDTDGCVLGIVSRSDLLKVFLRADDEVRRDVETVLRDVLWLVEDELSVQTEEGVVTVHGRVPRRSDAEGMRNVVHAEDDLGHEPDPGATWFDPHLSVHSVGAPSGRP
jgi:CBS domain-containing protein